MTVLSSSQHLLVLCSFIQYSLQLMHTFVILSLDHLVRSLSLEQMHSVTRGYEPVFIDIRASYNISA